MKFYKVNFFEETVEQLTTGEVMQGINIAGSTMQAATGCSDGDRAIIQWDALQNIVSRFAMVRLGQYEYIGSFPSYNRVSGWYCLQKEHDDIYKARPIDESKIKDAVEEETDSGDTFTTGTKKFFHIF